MYVPRSYQIAKGILIIRFLSQLTIKKESSKWIHSVESTVVVTNIIKNKIILITSSFFAVGTLNKTQQLISICISAVTGSHDAKCECCSALQYEGLVLQLSCEDGSSQPHKLASPKACSCSPCAGLVPPTWARPGKPNPLPPGGMFLKYKKIFY